MKSIMHGFQKLFKINEVRGGRGVARGGGGGRRRKCGNTSTLLSTSHFFGLKYMYLLIPFSQAF